MDESGYVFPPLDKDQWRAIVEKDLKGADFDRKMVRRTPSGIAIQPLYMDEDWPHADQAAQLPGATPYTRGSEPVEKAGSWAIRQEYAHPDPTRAKAIIARDLACGVDEIVLRLDPTGRQGIMITTTAQLGELLSDVDLRTVPVYIQAGPFIDAGSAMLKAVWEARGLAPVDRLGGYYLEPLSVLATRGSLPFSLDDQLKTTAALAVEADATMPGVCAAKISTKPYHNAGASADQELGFVLSTGLAYLKAMDAAGLGLTGASAQMHACMSAGIDFFRDIAKLRAVRTLWARMIAECGGDEIAQRLPLHTRNSQRVMTRRDPWVNILRATTGVFAAAIGGSTQITTTPFDALIGVSGEFGHRVARNIQILLREESHLDHVIDPAGGCWHLESLTDTLCEQGWSFFRKIEAEGGMAAVLQSGWALRQVDAVHEKRRQGIATRRIPVTGVSEYPLLDEKSAEVETVDLAALRARQPADPEIAPPSGGPVIEVPVFPMRRFAEPYERLRDASDAFRDVTGARPRAFLANMGPVASHTARATFASNFLNAGGIEVLGNPGFETPQAAAAAFSESGAKIAVICSSDRIYAELAADCAAALKGAGARTVILAGRMGDQQEAWRAAGVDMSIHLGCDVLDLLETLLTAEEVLR